MALIDDFKARFTEFDTAVVDASLPALILEYPAFYGGEYDDGSSDDDRAILYLLAHLLSIEVNAGTSGAPALLASSQTVGSVSVSFASGSTAWSAGWFETTWYGQRFWRITSQFGGARFV